MDFIQQNESISADEKSMLAKEVKKVSSDLEIAVFKLERTEKVKRTTAILLEETIEELEQKRKAVEAQNRDLEIESSLERVRTVAMGMRKPDEILEVCRIISQQSESLGIKEIRNVQTAIIYESKGTYLNYEYYVKHDKLLVTEVDYKNHELQSLFANQMLRGAEELFSSALTGREVQDWYDYQKTTNQFADSYLENAQSLNYYFYSLGPVALGISTYSPLNEEEINLFRRFRNVFDLAYRRFLDIEQAEAQAREAKIEASLERVRAQALSMRKPDDLPGICEVLFTELITLGFAEIRNAMINIHNDEKASFVNYDYSDEIGQSINHLAYNIHPLIEKQVKQVRSAEDAFSVTSFAKEDLKEWIAFRKKIGEKDDPRIENTDALYYCFYSIGTGSVGISTFSSITDEKLEVLKRFRNVFDFAYRRYTDVAQAEAQAREAQIELGLERVRARAMAMQNSSELADLVATLFKELIRLDFALTRCYIYIIDPDSLSLRAWTFNTEIDQLPESYFVKYIDLPYYKALIKAWKERKQKFVYELGGEEKHEVDRVLLNETEYSRLPEAVKSGMMSADRVFLSYSFNNFGGLQTGGLEPLSDENLDIFSRFGKVFDLTYTRFNDLKQAEAQALEAQIQLALERVRARTMAMQKSEELSETVTVLFHQFNALGERPERMAIEIVNEKENVFDIWATQHGGLQLNNLFKASLDEPHVMQKMYKAWKEQTKSITIDLQGKELEEYFQFLNKKGLPVQREIFGTRRVQNVATFSKGILTIITQDPKPQVTIDLLERFAKVFDGTYTRFLDLQKAEAQAREAQIEAALERVRSRTMAMQKSDELADVAQVLFQQVKQLGIKTWSTGVNIWQEGETSYIDWVVSTSDGQFMTPYTVDLTTHPFFMEISKAKKRGDDFFVIEAEGKTLAEHYRLLFKMAKIQFEDLLKSGFQMPEHQINHYVFGQQVSLMFITLEACPEAHDIFKRLGNVFEQTYTRFLDLQKAEAQAREARIEAALERVRSRTLAMQKSDELAETSAVLFQQLIQLGIEPNRLYITIIKDDQANAEFWITDEDGSKVSSAFETNLNNNPVFKKMLEGWKGIKNSLTIDMKGEELQEYFRYLSSLNVPFKGGLAQTRRIQYLGYFNRGFIGMASPVEQPEATIQLLGRFAAVFNLTFTRFNDLKIAEAHAIQAEEDLVKLQTEKQRAEEALAELQVTQKQLIQSEKMASLGELTAGIAHEIQNPLNFVNNFSEVSSELLDEMKLELDRGDAEEAKAIASDVKLNLEKILHHGKRADAIVKGMLQHSRSNSGVKELININALADEYLRLAYHGLRAKDKTFNATLNTEFDETIGKIEVVPQDIGRVILNLITNAFYVVDEKKKQQLEGYKPTVTISTKKSGDKVLISVKDNGNGIPQKVLDKIFQPFFTTKPTGEGTGLGLSLAYDIVKAHGGELKVETKEGESSEFIIRLPD